MVIIERASGDRAVAKVLQVRVMGVPGDAGPFGSSWAREWSARGRPLYPGLTPKLEFAKLQGHQAKRRIHETAILRVPIHRRQSQMFETAHPGLVACLGGFGWGSSVGTWGSFPALTLVVGWLKAG